MSAKALRAELRDVIGPLLGLIAVIALFAVIVGVMALGKIPAP